MFITDAKSGRAGLLVSINFIRWILIYNALVWLLFTMVYMQIDFYEHFYVPDDFQQSFSEKAYFSFQCTVQMFGTNVSPRTDLARGLVSLQSLMTYFQILVFLAPWALLPMRQP